MFNEDDLYETDDDCIENNYLTFNVENEIYAVDIGYVTEVIGIQKIAEVPDVPDFIKGVIHLRGKVITIMDVRSRFNMEVKDYTNRTCVIVLDIEDAPTGLVVDGVNEVIEIPEDKIAPPPSWNKSTGENSVISGIGKYDDKVSMILDVEKLVLEKEIVLPVVNDHITT